MHFWQKVRLGLFAGILVVVGLFYLFAALPAPAQMAQLPLTSGAGYPPQSVLPSPFRCAYFVRNNDGSWSPLRRITISFGDTKATLEPGVSFAAGTMFAGVDVAAELNRRCAPRFSAKPQQIR